MHDDKRNFSSWFVQLCLWPQVPFTGNTKVFLTFPQHEVINIATVTYFAVTCFDPFSAMEQTK